jgi:hypothetical protein
MSLHIDLQPETEERLEWEANRRGIDKTRLAREILESGLPPLTPKQRAVVALLQSWIDEDATNDTAEIEARAREWDAFEKALNESAGRVVFP